MKSVIALSLALSSVLPDLPFREAQAHVVSAVAVSRNATGYLSDKFLFLALAYVESRLLRHVVSYLKCSPKKKCVRSSAKWSGKTPPRHGRPSWFCGVLQVGGTVSWDKCRKIMDDIPGSYRMAADNLEMWYSGPCRRYGVRKKERISCSLRGYHGGYRMLQKTKDLYPVNVLTMAYRLKQKTRFYKQQLGARRVSQTYWGAPAFEM